MPHNSNYIENSEVQIVGKADGRPNDAVVSIAQSCWGSDQAPGPGVPGFGGGPADVLDRLDPSELEKGAKGGGSVVKGERVSEAEGRANGAQQLTPQDAVTKKQGNPRDVQTAIIATEAEIKANRKNIQELKESDAIPDPGTGRRDRGAKRAPSWGDSSDNLPPLNTHKLYPNRAKF
ncbi:MAG TPA: hypothetical protein V6D17_10355 [Candidatus Obscuribacterales bacterium]